METINPEMPLGDYFYERILQALSELMKALEEMREVLNAYADRPTGGLADEIETYLQNGEIN